MNQLTAVNQSTTTTPDAADISNIGHASDPQPCCPGPKPSLLGAIMAHSAVLEYAESNPPSPQYTADELQQVHIFLARKFGVVPKALNSFVKDQRLIWRAVSHSATNN